MIKNISKRNFQKKHILSLFLLIIALIFVLNNSSTYAFFDSFKKINGPDIKDDKILVKKSQGEYSFDIEDDKFPSKVCWSWEGKGQAFLYVEYSDKNIIYYLMGNSEVPNIENITFIDSQGIPRIIVPKVFRIPEGKVTLDFINAYYKYYGNKDVNVEKINFKINTDDSVKVEDFEVLSYKDKIHQDECIIQLDDEQKKLYLEIQIPQGNKKDYYLLRDENLPIEISLRALVDKDTEGYIRLIFPRNIKIISCNNENIELVDESSFEIPIYAVKGYNEEKIMITVNLEGSGLFKIQAALGDEVTNISNDIKVIDLETVKSKISLLEEGVYPIQKNTKHDIVLKKELKNNIKIKENVFDWVHRVIGSSEDHDSPAGLISGVFKNHSEYDIPVHVKFSVLDENGEEIIYFRGEHFDKEEEEKDVPETNIVVKSGDTVNLKMPVFADAYSVKPGKYTGQMKVSFFGSNSEIIVREFDLYVHKESQIQRIIGILAITLSIFCLILLSTKQRKWIIGLKTSEVMLIALFTTVKFALVDVSWFVMGDFIRALLGPLGPFMHIVTGIFWDVINSLFLVALISLVTKPGVVIISTIVRIILKGVAFGTFNPVSLLLMMSYSVIADGFLYLVGFTSGRREVDTNYKVFISLAIIFGIQNCYSTYTFYYIWMYLYRMFYPNWYININATFSIVYSIVGSISGVYLGKKLKKVID